MSRKLVKSFQSCQDVYSKIWNLYKMTETEVCEKEKKRGNDGNHVRKATRVLRSRMMKNHAEANGKMYEIREIKKYFILYFVKNNIYNVNEHIICTY